MSRSLVIHDHHIVAGQRPEAWGDTKITGTASRLVDPGPVRIFVRTSDKPKRMGQGASMQVSGGLITGAVLAEIELLPDPVRSSGLSATALTLASRLDQAAARDSSALARELRACLTELRHLAAAVPAEADPVDELAAKRAARRADASLPDGPGPGDRSRARDGGAGR